jgi:hypothetical protein
VVKQNASVGVAAGIKQSTPAARSQGAGHRLAELDTW